MNYPFDRVPGRDLRCKHAIRTAFREDLVETQIFFCSKGSVHMIFSTVYDGTVHEDYEGDLEKSLEIYLKNDD